jgi:cold shock CspA family protein
MITGRIASFDERRGDGTFLADDGHPFYFHCVDIRDGSRMITPGVRASGERRVGRLGRDEVANVAALA